MTGRTEAFQPLHVEPQRAALAALAFSSGIAVDRTTLRLAVGAVILGLRMARPFDWEPYSIANLGACIAYAALALGMALPAPVGSLPFLLPHWLRRTLEVLLGMTILVTGGPTMVTFVAIAVALFVPEDYFRRISRVRAIRAALVAAFGALAVLAAGHSLPGMPRAAAALPDAMAAVAMLALFSPALVTTRPRDNLHLPDDEIAHHVAFASKSLVERLLELIGERIGAPVMLACSSKPEDGRSLLLVRDGEVSVPTGDDDICVRLGSGAGERTAFLFDTHARSRMLVLRGDRLGTITEPDFAEAWQSVLPPARGAAIPFAMARVQGWLYVLTERPLSQTAYLEMRNAVAAIGALIYRFERFDSWRERTLAEARLLASRDMHDSVLQTLAGLRMQMSSLVKTSENGVPEALHAQLCDIDAIVAAEQSHLREILKRSKEDAETAAELFSYLYARAQSLARQWNTRCAIQMPDEELPVSEETAIECEFLLREAMANAVQHAHAELVAISLAMHDNTLLMTFRTDGLRVRADPEAAQRRPVESRSLRQRVEKLGGTAYLEPVKGGGILAIQIPLEMK